MRTHYILILFLCCTIGAIAQTTYEVTASTFLNIRSYADASAPIIGTIDRGGKVEVWEIKNDWAKIKYDDDYAYVNASYIRKVNTSTSIVEKEKTSFDFNFDFLQGTKNLEWLVFVIAGISVLLFIFRKIRGKDGVLEDGVYVMNWILFLAVCIVELIYVTMMGGDVIWFCIPDTVGWLWTIIDFILFAFVVYNQLMCLFDTLSDIQHNTGGYCDLRWGLYSWCGAVVLGILAGIFSPDLLPVVLVVFAVFQLIQIVQICRSMVPQGGWGNAILCVSVYLLGTIATVIILAHFLVLLIIVLVGLLVLYIVGKSSESSSRRCCQNCRYYSGGYCSYRSETIYDSKNTVCDSYS